MKQNIFAILLSIILVILIAYYNGCSSYQEGGQSPLAPSLCEGGYCPPNPRDLEIRITPVDPVQNAHTHIYVSGECSVGDFPRHNVYLRIEYENGDPISEYSTVSEKTFCNNNSYSFSLAIPCSIAHSAACTGLGGTVFVRTWIEGVDRYGQAWKNPSGEGQIVEEIKPAGY